MNFYIIKIIESGKLLVNEREAAFKKRVKELKKQKVAFKTFTAKAEHPTLFEPNDTQKV